MPSICSSQEVTRICVYQKKGESKVGGRSGVHETRNPWLEKYTEKETLKQNKTKQKTNSKLDEENTDFLISLLFGFKKKKTKQAKANS